MPKIQNETVLQSSADSFYHHFKTNLINAPQYLPEIIKSIQVLKGDGMNMGTVTHWKYAIGGNILNGKETIEDVDDENRSLTYKMIEGDVMNLYDSFRFKIHVIPLGENECSVQHSVEFVKAHEHVPTPNEYLSLTSMIIREMAHHLN